MLSEIENLDQKEGEYQVAGKLNREIQMDEVLGKFSINSFCKNALNALNQVDRIDKRI
jgi:hypothetical protein